MAIENDIFLRACRQEPTERIPVWFMRQAGRSLPYYTELRKTYDVLTIARTPELAAAVCIEPIEILGVDVAVLFADIMLLPITMGIDVRIVDNVGPIIDEPISVPADISRLQLFDPKNAAYLSETINSITSKITIPLIGFSGGPFTLASYLIEGSPTRTWAKTKRFMFEESDSWHKLMSILSDGIIGYLLLQIDAGVNAVQLFDSWVGCLSPADYREYVLPYSQKIFTALKHTGVPRIHFGTDTAGMLADFADVDCEVIGVDWRVDLMEAKKMIGNKAIQGNLDPAVLLGNEEYIHKKVDELIDPLMAAGIFHKGYIFSLGHSLLSGTDDILIKKLVDYVHGK